MRILKTKTILKAALALQELSSPHAQVGEVAKSLEAAGVKYCVIGGVALSPHNFHRATDDLDLLVSKGTFPLIEKELVGLGWSYITRGSKRKFWYHGFRKVEVEVLVEGDSNHGQIMPDPESVRQKINGVWYLSLPSLLSFKLIAGRPRDLRDVQDLIQANSWPVSYVAIERYTQLWNELHQKD